MGHPDVYERKEKLKKCFSLEVMEECLPAELVQEYKEAFEMLDRKKVGKISVRDVSTMVCSIGICLSEPDLLQFVGKVVEVKRNDFTLNCLLFPQFLAVMTAIITNCVPEKEAKRIFQEFDKDGDGYITEDELRNLLRQLGDDVDDNEIQEMMAEADKDGDGMVSLQEFIDVMNSVHSDSKHVSETYPLPRILTQNNEHSNPSEEVRTSCSSDVSSSQDMDEEELENSTKENQSSNDKMTLIGKPEVPKPKSNRRRKSIIDWLKGPPKESELRCTEMELSAEGLTSSSYSVASDAATATPERVRRRRKSSIAKTLRNGKDVFLATAKTIRKFSE